MKNKKVLLAAISTLALVLAFVIGAWMYEKEQRKKMSFMAQENAEVFVRDYSPRRGAEEPQAYLVEFLDPECESCRDFNPLVKSILNEFEGKVQLVVRYAPFHGNSIFAIKILEAARRQDKYWEVLEVMFQHQPEWGSHHHPRPELIWNFLPRAGVDIEKIQQDMNDPEIQKRIMQDQKDGEALQVRGTPTFFVNGKYLEDFGYEQLREMVRKEISE